LSPPPGGPPVLVVVVLGAGSATGGFTTGCTGSFTGRLAWRTRWTSSRCPGGGPPAGGASICTATRRSERSENGIRSIFHIAATTNVPITATWANAVASKIAVVRRGDRGRVMTRSNISVPTHHRPHRSATAPDSPRSQCDVATPPPAAPLASVLPIPRAPQQAREAPWGATHAVRI
jgi:hypothetical protein